MNPNQLHQRVAELEDQLMILGGIAHININARYKITEILKELYELTGDELYNPETSHK